MSQTLSPLYFGKLPGRGDFVRSSAHPALIQSLDRWLSSGIELMAEDAHWKPIYDQADAAHFAMISPHRHTGVLGHIVPSADQSGRRFPFLTAAAIESENGSALMSLGPWMFQRAWGALSLAAQRARAAEESQVATVLAEIGGGQLPPLLSASESSEQHQRFLETTTVASLMQELAATGTELDVRQILLALGLLLQPVMGNSGQAIDKGLNLPLPQDEATRCAVATFWMDLISRFLRRSQHDLTLFMPLGTNHPPCLLVGFSAGAAGVLQGLLDARVSREVFISLNQSPWVEDYVTNDYALKKFSSYLLTPQMSLAQVLASFQEAFLGS